MLAIILFSSIVYAQPDNATLNWYPSSYIHRFVNSCFDSLEVNQVPSVCRGMVLYASCCACVLDKLRHSLTWEEIEKTGFSEEMQSIIEATLPFCVSQELIRIKQ
tara:strand:+ start:704 stop:1018 length:315 start_codon:yes stop_codon:yes gene_type:complete